MAIVSDALPAPAPAVHAKKKRSLPELIEDETERRRRRRLLAAAVFVAVVAVVLATWALLRPKPAPLAARFRSAAVTRGDVVRQVHATGHLEAITTVQVGAETSGRIATVEADYNDRVRAGQVLARFDRAALEAQLAQARAAVATARSTLAQAKTDRERVARDKARLDRLFASGSISETEHDSMNASDRLMNERVSAAEAQVDAQEASLTIAKTNLDHSVIRAPIDGVVITRNVDPGQTVASMLTTPVLFTVAADLGKMHVIAAVDEADIGEVATRQRATFTVNAYPNRTFEGTVTEVRSSPQVVQDVVTYGTEVEVDNADLALKPGMTATVRIDTATAKDSLRVPAGALRFTPPGVQPPEATGVWLLAGPSLRRVDAQPGISDGETTAVQSDLLHPGDEVVYELTPVGRKAYGIAH